jgi:hypothetical protein
MTYNMKYWLSLLAALITYSLTFVVILSLKTHPNWYLSVGIWNIFLIVLTAIFFANGMYSSLHLKRDGGLRYQLFVNMFILILMYIFYYTIIYFAYYDISPAYFHYSGGQVHHRLNAVDFFYFSVSTFATVGYGDITADTSLLRLIVTTEIFMGIFVLIFLISNADAIYKSVIDNKQ